MVSQLVVDFGPDLIAASAFRNTEIIDSFTAKPLHLLQDDDGFRLPLASGASLSEAWQTVSMEHCFVAKSVVSAKCKDLQTAVSREKLIQKAFHSMLAVYGNDQRLIHASILGFIVAGSARCMTLAEQYSSGEDVSVELLHVCASRSVLRRQNAVLGITEKVDSRVCVRPYAAALALTSSDEREAGVVVAVLNDGSACNAGASTELAIFSTGVLCKLAALQHPESVLKSNESLAIRILAVSAWMQQQQGLQPGFQLVLCGHPDTATALESVRVFLGIDVCVRGIGEPHSWPIMRGAQACLRNCDVRN